LFLDDAGATSDKTLRYGRAPRALYVLSLVDYTAERPEIKRAIDFLVATQKPDGSWPMISRST
jgi:squalene cyclase